MNRIVKFLFVYSPIYILPAILLAGFFVSVEDLPPLSVCLFKIFFKFDCPGCGLTRAFLSIPKGHILEAVHFNAASPVLYAGFWLMWISLVCKRVYQSFREPPAFDVLRVFMSQMILVLMTGHWVFKVWQYFAGHSLSEYLHSLVSQGNLLTLWIKS